MTIRVVIVDNPLDPRGWEDVVVGDARAFLAERFSSWPRDAAIYDLRGIDPARTAGANLRAVLADRDVTPRDEAGVEALAACEGPLLVTIAPADPITAVIAVVAIVVGIAAAVFLAPKLPTTGADAYQSPNNSLARRTNKARPTARIPEIFGTVRATPDLLTVPYRTWVGNLEVETALLCVGRGAYDVSDVREGDTPLDGIAGASAAIYGPSTSPNSGDAPQLLIGEALNDPVYSVVGMGDINGQTVRPPNGQSATGNGDIRFIGPDQVETADSDTDFTSIVDPGEKVRITNGGAYDGTFTVAAVSARRITLRNPGATNASWAALGNGGTTTYYSATVSNTSDASLGPFVVGLPDMDRVILNFVARAGLYAITNKNKQLARSVQVQAELRPVNAAGTPTGLAETFSATLVGSATEKDQVALTLTATPTFRGRMQVVVRRITPTDKAFDGTLVDEVKLDVGYGLAEVSQKHFGNVTTAHVRSYSTAGATSVKERRFNLLATRRVPARRPDGTFGDLVATDRVDAILCAIALDPQIGNRSLEEVDADDIYDRVAEVEDYFGSSDAVRFGYTFDDDNTSAEEMMTAVAAAAFCRPYRQGSLIRLGFERLDPTPALLFNHRNILPGSQNVQSSFGPVEDHDGVELEWTDPDDGSPLTLSIPADGSALQPRKVEVVGVRSARLAAWHANRAMNRIIHQHTTIEQRTGAEAALVKPGDRVRVTDQTRVPGPEGEIEAQDGAVLTLSQPCDLDPALDHTIYLQHVNETVELIPVKQGANPWTVVAARVPDLPLVVDVEALARSRYEIVTGRGGRTRECLVTEREPDEHMIETLRVVNYTPLYYGFDALRFWLSLEGGLLADASAWAVGITANQGGEVAARGEGYVYRASGSSSVEAPLPVLPSYAKTAWVNVGAAELLNNGNETFAVRGARAVAAHGDANVSAPIAPGWRLVGVSFDGTALSLYVDGEPVGRVAAPYPTPGLQRLLVGVAGDVADLRLYGIALDDEAHRALYRYGRRIYQ